MLKLILPLLVLGMLLFIGCIEKGCSPDNLGACDRNCSSDEDCWGSCGCGCISKNETCYEGMDIKCESIPCECKEGVCSVANATQKECETAADCEGKPWLNQCAGEWACIESKCEGQCHIECTTETDCPNNAMTGYECLKGVCVAKNVTGKCSSDTDCKSTCGCGCLLKEEACPVNPPQGMVCDELPCVCSEGACVAKNYTEKCSPDNMDACDKSCSSDTGCYGTCGCGCVSKGETCHINLPAGVACDAVAPCMCKEGVCTAKNHTEPVVTLTTDKEEYAKGETVSIRVYTGDPEGRICCESYGYGSEMVKCCESYELTTPEECVYPADYVGGGKQIVADSYCGEPETTIYGRKEWVDALPGISFYRMENSEWTAVRLCSTAGGSRCVDGVWQQIAGSPPYPEGSIMEIETPASMEWEQTECVQVEENCSGEVQMTYEEEEVGAGTFKVELCYWLEEDVSPQAGVSWVEANEADQKCIEKQFTIS